MNEKEKKWLEAHEVAFIAANRAAIKDITCGTNPEDVKLLEEYGETGKYENGNTFKYYPLTPEQNNERNKQLRAALSGRYKITGELNGFYPENGQHSQDYTFFVWNETKRDGFYDDMFKLSEWYNQDNFLYKATGSNEFYLTGTNANRPGPGNKDLAGNNMAWNTINKYMTQDKNRMCIQEAFAFTNKYSYHGNTQQVIGNISSLVFRMINEHLVQANISDLKCAMKQDNK